MSERTRAELKTKFENGDVPTQDDFADLIDSAYNKEDDKLPTAADLAKKVDKVSGKGLSTNDFTDALKNQLLNANVLFGKLHEEENGNIIEWNHTHNANGFVTAGTYRIKGQRTNNADNLPIGNVGSGHTLDGILYVFDSSLMGGTGQTDDSTITQLLVLSNRVGGQEGGQWIRSGYGVNTDSLTWDPWAKMQTNMEVGVVNDTMQLMDSAGNQTLNASLGMNSLVDNGIYSGVYLPNNGTSVGTDAETFVMVVLNNYAVAGEYKTVTQIKFATSVGEFGEGSVTSNQIVAPFGCVYRQLVLTTSIGAQWTDWEYFWLPRRVAPPSSNLVLFVDDAAFGEIGNLPIVVGETVVKKMKVASPLWNRQRYMNMDVFINRVSLDCYKAWGSSRSGGWAEDFELTLTKNGNSDNLNGVGDARITLNGLLPDTGENSIFDFAVNTPHFSGKIFNRYKTDSNVTDSHCANKIFTIERYNNNFTTKIVIKEESLIGRSDGGRYRLILHSCTATGENQTSKTIIDSNALS